MNKVKDEDSERKMKKKEKEKVEEGKRRIEEIGG